MSKDEKKYTEADLVSMIRGSHSAARGWAVLTQVCNDTGGKDRTCDAIALSTWKSDGNKKLHGFEVKTTRSDWVREMQDLDKSETFAKHCDYWWIVAPAGVVKLEELPATWGLMEPVGNGLKVRRPATKLIPEPVSRGFLCALLRRVTEQSPAEAELERVRKASYQQGHKDGVEHASDRLARAQGAPEAVLKELADLKETVRKFQEVSGVRLDSWGLGDVSEAVRELVSRGRNLGWACSAVFNAAAELRRQAESLDKTFWSLKEVAAKQGSDPGV